VDAAIVSCGMRYRREKALRNNDGGALEDVLV